MQLAVVHDNFIYPISFSDGIVMIVQGENGGGENGVNPQDGEFSWYDSYIGNVLSGFVDAYQESDYDQSILSAGLYNWQDLTGYVYITPFDDNDEYTFPFRLYTVNNNVTDQLVGLDASQFYSLNTTQPLVRPGYMSSIFTISDDMADESTCSFTPNLSLRANQMYLAIVTIFGQMNRTANNYDVRSIPYLSVSVTNAIYQSTGYTTAINTSSTALSVTFVFCVETAGNLAMMVHKGVFNGFLPDGGTAVSSANTFGYVNNRVNASGVSTYNQNLIEILEMNQLHYNT